MNIIILFFTSSSICINHDDTTDNLEYLLSEWTISRDNYTFKDGASGSMIAFDPNSMMIYIFGGYHDQNIFNEDIYGYNVTGEQLMYITHCNKTHSISSIKQPSLSPTLSPIISSEDSRFDSIDDDNDNNNSIGNNIIPWVNNVVSNAVIIDHKMYFATLRSVNILDLDLYIINELIVFNPIINEPCLIQKKNEPNKFLIIHLKSDISVQIFDTLTQSILPLNGSRLQNDHIQGIDL